MKVLLGFLLAVLLIASIALFMPDLDGESEISVGTEAESVTGNSATNKDDTANASSEEMTADYDDKYASMQAEYEKLEQARRHLKKRLFRLKHEIWGLKWPPDQAKSINDLMLAGFKMLNTPKMLGAFSNVKGIQDEIARVEYSNKNLDQVQAMIEQTGKQE